MFMLEPTALLCSSLVTKQQQSYVSSRHHHQLTSSNFFTFFRTKMTPPKSSLSTSWENTTNSTTWSAMDPRSSGNPNHSPTRPFTCGIDPGRRRPILVTAAAVLSSPVPWVPTTWPTAATIAPWPAVVPSPVLANESSILQDTRISPLGPHPNSRDILAILVQADRESRNQPPRTTRTPCRAT